MPIPTPVRDGVVSPRTVQLAITVAALVMLAGMILPGWRTWRHVRIERETRTEMAAIAEGVLRFMRDTGVPPTRGRDGDPQALFRLLGPGLIAEGSYYYPDRHQGGLEDHLITNRPQGARNPGYSGWHGPYVEPLTADPWGFAYVVVVYPLTRDDDRDCVIISAGPNGHMDGSYASPRDVIPAGDDLIYCVVDKSPERRSPIR